MEGETVRGGGPFDRLGLSRAKTAILLPVHLTNTIDSRVALQKEESGGWGESAAWWIDKILKRDIAATKSGERTIPLWEEDDGEGNGTVGWDDEKKGTRLRITSSAHACIFGGDSLLTFLPEGQGDEMVTVDAKADKISGKREKSSTDTNKESTARRRRGGATVAARVESVTLAIHAGGSAILTFVLAWGVKSSAASPSLSRSTAGIADELAVATLGDLQELLQRVSEQNSSKLEWCRKVRGRPQQGSPSTTTQSPPKIEGDSQQQPHHSLTHAHLTSLGNIVGGVYEGTGTSLASLADWLVALPAEPPAFPPSRVPHRVPLFHHTFAILTEDLRTAAPDISIDQIFNEFHLHKSPHGHITPSSMSQAVISYKGALCLAWQTGNSRLNARRLCEAWMGYLLDTTVVDTLLIRDTLQRIARSSLHLAELWEVRRRNFEERKRNSLPGEWDEFAMEYDRQQEEDDEELKRDMRRLLSLLAIADVIQQLEDSNAAFRPTYADKFRTELQKAMAVPTIAETTRDYLEQQLMVIHQTTAAIRKISDKKERELKQDKYLIEETKRRKYEMIIQSITAVTLPMFLVTNYWAMNVPGVPQISYWDVLLITFGIGGGLLFILFLVYSCYFLDRKRAKRGMQRWFRRLQRKVLMSQADDSPDGRIRFNSDLPSATLLRLRRRKNNNNNKRHDEVPYQYSSSDEEDNDFNVNGEALGDPALYPRLPLFLQPPVSTTIPNARPQRTTPMSAPRMTFGAHDSQSWLPDQDTVWSREGPGNASGSNGRPRTRTMPGEWP